MRQYARSPSLRWILMAVVFWCFLILSGVVHGAVVGSVKSDPGPQGLQDSVTLHSEQGSICPDGSKRAVYYVSKTKENIEGCYVVREGMVFMAFVDGDNGALPISRFTWAEGMKPQSAPSDRQGVGPGRDTKGTPPPDMPIIAQRGTVKDVGWM